MIKVVNTKIDDVKIIVPEIYNDSRGYFFESFVSKEFKEMVSNVDFVQDNQSKSSYGVLRGLHFQNPPHEQSKLVRVLKGRIQDIAVDLRSYSETYKKYVSVILDDKSNNQLFIPKGCAHGFVVLSKEAIVSYKVDEVYNPVLDNGYRYDDPNFNINWNVNKKEIILSDKDKKLPFLSD